MNAQSRYKISASSFYDLSKCHRRVYLDLYGNPEERGEYPEFRQMLWEKGVQIEREIIERIRKDKEVVTVEGEPGPGAFKETLELMEKGAPLIYQGVLIDGDSVGRPDILEKTEGSSDLGAYHYVPCDIKSGRATRVKEGAQVKLHYANQVLFYAELLEKIQGKKPDTGKIIDIEGDETSFPIKKYQNAYEESKAIVKSIAYDRKEPEPIIGGVCKECVWFNHCYRLALKRQDPTLLFKLSSQKYQLRERGIKNIKDLSRIDVSDFVKGPNKITGVGKKKLEQWKRRANAWIDNKPVLHTRCQLREAKREIFYDIEDDPTVDHVYLHGFIEVTGGKKGEYKSILALAREDEERGARELWRYIDSLSEDDVIYHYGSYEKVRADRLKEKYGLPESTMEKFDRLRVDLYRILEASSDWPAFSYGIKSVAKCLGFKWTSKDASGADSIVWYNEYRRDPENKELLEKILTYNKEDCEAMILVKNFLHP